MGPDATVSYTTISLYGGGRTPPTTPEIYVPELPLGQVYFESYQLWWIGEEARTAFHKRSARNEKHLSQLLGVSAV